MKIVIDMHLSPEWVPFLVGGGHTVTHWSSVGSHRATDREILTWARERQQVLLTHDLDFGAILAATSAAAPSVIQVRTQDSTPRHCGQFVEDILRRYADALSAGARISMDEARARLRILPLKRMP